MHETLGGGLFRFALDFSEEAACNAKKSDGRFDVTRVSDTGDDIHRGAREPRGQFSGDRRELRVVSPGDEAHRDAHGSQGVVERRRGAGSPSAQ